MKNVTHSISDLGNLAKLKEKVSESTFQKLKKLQETTQEVESLFIKDYLSKTRAATFQPNSLGTMGQFAWDSFFEGVAKHLSSRSPFGISRILYEQHAKNILRTEIAKQSSLGNQNVEV